MHSYVYAKPEQRVLYTSEFIMSNIRWHLEFINACVCVYSYTASNINGFIAVDACARKIKASLARGGSGASSAISYCAAFQ